MIKELDGVSFITFARDESEDLIMSLEAIRAVADSTNLPIEVIAVNDGSSDGTKSALENYFRSGVNPSLVRVIHQSPQGIATSILEGLKHSRYSRTIPLPGHFMFDSKALQKLVEHAFDSDITVGYRSNLRSERPIQKYFAALLLRMVFFLLISKQIRDPHGLIVYPTWLLRKVVTPDMKHENHIRTLAYAIGLGLTITNTPIPIRVGHKDASKAKGRPSSPRLLHVYSAFQELLLSRKKMRNASWP